jgi:hypothetical protein
MLTATRWSNSARYCSTVDQLVGSAGFPSRPEFSLTDNKPAGVDHAGTGTARNVAAPDLDPLAVDSDAAGEADVAGAIDICR